MSHAKDLCTCGHRRASHRGEDGPCMHRHVPACKAFDLQKAWTVLSFPALTLLADLKETSEPLAAVRKHVADELHNHGFAEYYADAAGRYWIKASPAGLAYLHENGASDD